MIFKEASEVAKSDVKFTGVNINAALAIIAQEQKTNIKIF